VGSESVEETEVWKNALKKIIEELLQLMLSTVSSVNPLTKSSANSKQLGSSPTATSNMPTMLSPSPKDFDQMSAFDVTNSDVDDDDLYDLSDDTSDIENEYMSGNSVLEETELDITDITDIADISATPKGDGDNLNSSPPS